jgi:hypothetical protein
MTDRPVSSSLLVRLRLAVGVLGERDANGWWPSSFLEPASAAFLTPVFGRTALLAQFHGVSEAARRVHDARLAAGSYHLFRLPEETEQDLHALVRDAAAPWGDLAVPDAAQALVALREIASGEGASSPGPRLIGPASALHDASVWATVAAAYHDAFSQGFQSYPFFARA